MGKMGQTTARVAGNSPEFVISAGYDLVPAAQAQTYPVFNSIKLCPPDCDVIIDFSSPQNLTAILEYALEHKLPLVLATTGLTEDQQKQLADASGQIAVFQSANMSLGANLLMTLAQTAAQALETGYDIEIVEKHHNQKVDAPSGTALSVAQAINSALSAQRDYRFERQSRREKRPADEIGIHAIRGGTIVGDHTVIFAGLDEVIEITHKAASRDIFAAGALRAASFIVRQNPGLYNFQSLIGHTS
jgi:4-hydroxy-tetrahydrodipicolinate reductase